MRTRIYIIMLALGLLTALAVYASEESSEKPAADEKAMSDAASILKTEMDKVSYIIGTTIARQFKEQSLEINIESFLMGLKDVLADRELVIIPEETQKIMIAFSQKMNEKMLAERAKREAERKAQAPINLAKSNEFLESNKTKEGVHVLPSGLQYKIITEGTGDIPKATDTVKVNYRGTFIDGTEFDSSYKSNQPVEFPVNGVIKGWTEALQIMKTGSKWQLFIPPDLAYGEPGRGNIQPNTMLIFEVELLDIIEPDNSTQPQIKMVE